VISTRIVIFWFALFLNFFVSLSVSLACYSFYYIIICFQWHDLIMTVLEYVQHDSSAVSWVLRSLERYTIFKRKDFLAFWRDCKPAVTCYCFVYEAWLCQHCLMCVMSAGSVALLGKLYVDVCQRSLNAGQWSCDITATVCRFRHSHLQHCIQRKICHLMTTSAPWTAARDVFKFVLYYLP